MFELCMIVYEVEMRGLPDVYEKQINDIILYGPLYMTGKQTQSQEQCGVYQKKEGA